MQKFIRISAIVATALVAMSLLLILVSIPLQSVIARNVFNYPAEFMALLPQIPVVQLLTCFVRLACIALLIICCGNKKGGIWPEVAVFVLLVAVVPTLGSVGWVLYSQLFVNLRGYAYSGANTAVNNITSFCAMPAGLGQAIAYVACGMSIAFKRLSRKTETQ